MFFTKEIFSEVLFCKTYLDNVNFAKKNFWQHRRYLFFLFKYFKKRQESVHESSIEFFKDEKKIGNTDS